MSYDLAIIGGGKWGQALQQAFLSAGHEAAIVSKSQTNLPRQIDISTALESELLVSAISVQATREWLEANYRDRGAKILVASKGIDTGSGAFLNEIYAEFAPAENLAFLSGPGFAAEVTAKLPTALVIASQSEQTAAAFMRLFPAWIKTYRTDDIVGAEIAGAYKNVIAIATGVCDSLAQGANARAALITRGLAEMTRFGLKFGARTETFLGLAGVGDLTLTATSVLSRNYRVGQALGAGKSLDATLAELGEVAEGVPTARAIGAISRDQNLHTPIANEVVALFDGKNPKECLLTLLMRTKDREW
jgi:glycerol-3-phosphate dehydrogenase (NAD(P)+)